MRDYTNVKNPRAKPFIYKNSNQIHANWFRILETIGVALFIAFFVFIANRFGAFQQVTVEHSTVLTDIKELKNDVQNIQVEAATQKTIVTHVVDVLEDIKHRQDRYYSINKQDRKKDIEDLKRSLK